ncbi:MAG: ABC transporter ATP-binding protein, partial [Burkholderiales bacterium]|nr:ABC transporter ATP-binding protein [Burkholderiales bacterium]
LASGGRLLALFPSHADHAIGEHVGIRVQADHLVAFLLASQAEKMASIAEK